MQPQSCYLFPEYEWGMLKPSLLFMQALPHTWYADNGISAAMKDMVVCWNRANHLQLEDDVIYILEMNPACRGRYLYAYPMSQTTRWELYEIQPQVPVITAVKLRETMAKAVHI